jgi:hypothetical protein
MMCCLPLFSSFLFFTSFFSFLPSLGDALFPVGCSILGPLDTQSSLGSGSLDVLCGSLCQCASLSVYGEVRALKSTNKRMLPSSSHIPLTAFPLSFLP